MPRLARFCCSPDPCEITLCTVTPSYRLLQAGPVPWCLCPSRPWRFLLKANCFIKCPSPCWACWFVSGCIAPAAMQPKWHPSQKNDVHLPALVAWASITQLGWRAGPPVLSLTVPLHRRALRGNTLSQEHSLLPTTRGLFQLDSAFIDDACPNQSPRSLLRPAIFPTHRPFISWCFAIGEWPLVPIPSIYGTQLFK